MSESDEVLEPDVGAYELVDVEAVQRAAAAWLVLTSLALEALEVRGIAPTITRALRFGIPRVDPYSVRRRDDASAAAG